MDQNVPVLVISSQLDEIMVVVHHVVQVSDGGVRWKIISVKFQGNFNLALESYIGWFGRDKRSNCFCYKNVTTCTDGLMS